MRMRVLRRADYRRMPWKNGGGWTTQLAAFPESGTNAVAPFDWRVSIAEIEQLTGLSFGELTRRDTMLRAGTESAGGRNRLDSLADITL